MNTFLKLNVLGMLYACIIFVPVELFVNISRIRRVTGLNLDTVGIAIGVMALATAVLLSALIIYITKKSMSGRKSSFWSILLWVPYFILFIFIFASLFPITNPMDEGGPGDGLIILGLLFVYPIYVLFLNFYLYSAGLTEKE